MEWYTIVIYAGALIMLGVVILALSALMGPRKYSAAKLSPYECGVPLISDTRERFSVKFYLIALLFILFDIETVFLLPWAVIFRSLGVVGLIEMSIFLGVLGFGLVYIIRRGVFEWD